MSSSSSSDDATRAAAADADDAGSAGSADDEMVDGREDLEAPGRLGEYLTFCRDQLLEIYRVADRRALFWQKSYRDLILLAAILTTAALFVDASQLAFRQELPEGYARVELVLALASALIVAFALRGRWQKQWLLRRYQAERYRLLKFRMLTDADLWRAHPRRDWRSKFSEEVHRIGKLEHDNLEEEASHDEVAELLRPGSPGPEREDVARLLDYYGRRRLTLQIDYFERAAGRSRSVFLDPLWVPAVFFLSMALVVVHFIAEPHDAHRQETIGLRILAVLPILLPAMLAGFRLRVTANELARNRNRSLARKSALEQIAGRLGALDPKQIVRVTETLRETREPPGVRISRNVQEDLDPAWVLSQLALAEQVLASDQHEWLRLMLEAEWYK